MEKPRLVVDTNILFSGFNPKGYYHPIVSGIYSGRLLLDSGLMADLCNYPSEIDMDGRILYSPIMLGFALMPKSCGSTALCYTHSIDQPGIR
uniref:Uncharacterized protein n=1 Tax=Candidatus Kentrum sp. FM TaxID=2126340 RepID=A0A450TFB0_9GAMM|nr:MAG: hypothetical protein BECKFM1743C_GA0114222_104043 [Candidatus Kentron sp. FM]VFJ65962.1 MAG: hypothetical protein BECKFM1743A_GA0114220_103963 [Candidatus Kentron sp. FM]